jgi:hypothetical protein
MSFGCWFRVSGALCFCFLRVFIAEEVDGIADKGSGNNTLVDVRILMKACFFLVIKLPFLGPLFTSAGLSYFHITRCCVNGILPYFNLVTLFGRSCHIAVHFCLTVSVSLFNFFAVVLMPKY